MHGGAFPGLRVTATGVEAMAAGEAGKIAFANDAGFELAALIEDRTWTRDALTAPEVISLQVFRDLFAEATLRPGDEAAVGPDRAAVHRPARLDGALRAGRRCGGLQHRARALRLPGLDRARP